MNILFRLCLPNSTNGVCSVPDELDNGTIAGIDAIGEIVCDAVASIISVEWKFNDEPDDKYRTADFAEWSNINELAKEIERLT